MHFGFYGWLNEAIICQEYCVFFFFLDYARMLARLVYSDRVNNIKLSRIKFETA